MKEKTGPSLFDTLMSLSPDSGAIDFSVFGDFEKLAVYAKLSQIARGTGPEAQMAASRCDIIDQYIQSRISTSES